MTFRANMIGFACCVAVGFLSVFVLGPPFEMKRGIFDGLALSVLFTVGFVVGVRDERRRERVRRAVGGASNDTAKRALDALETKP